MNAPQRPVWVIPSYRRIETLQRKTLRTLMKGGVQPADITVWVADENEHAAYTSALGTEWRIRISAPTLRASRNHIVRAYPPGTPLMFCDDDIERLDRRKDENNRTPVTDIPAFVEEGFERANRAGARLWGVFPNQNPRFMKDRIRYGLVFCIGVFYGHTVKGDDADLVELHDKDDYERTIRCYLADGVTMRFDYVGPTTRYYTEPGGMQETRTDRSADRSALIIARRYPKLATMYRSSSGRAEIRLKDTRGKQ